MSAAWTALPRPLRLLIPCLMAVFLIAASVSAPPARAQEDDSSVIVSIAVVGALVGLLVYLAQSGREMIEAQLVERGCPVPEQILPSTLDSCIRRTDYLEAHPEIDPRVADHILHGRFAMGMTAAEVEASIGPPTTINRSVHTYGVSEQWVYRQPGGYSANYLYFDDGILTSWQTST